MPMIRPLFIISLMVVMTLLMPMLHFIVASLIRRLIWVLSCSVLIGWLLLTLVCTVLLFLIMVLLFLSIIVILRMLLSPTLFILVFENFW